MHGTLQITECVVKYKMVEMTLIWQIGKGQTMTQKSRNTDATGNNSRQIAAEKLHGDRIIKSEAQSNKKLQEVASCIWQSFLGKE